MVVSDWLQFPITFKLQNTGVATIATRTVSAAFAYCST